MKNETKYCFLKGIVVDTSLDTKTIHHFNFVVQVGENKYRVNVNVQSKIKPSGLKFHIKQNSNHDILTRCFALDDGPYIHLKKGHEGHALDYLRTNIFDVNLAQVLQKNSEEEAKKLQEILSNYFSKIINNPIYRIGVWGMAYSYNQDHFAVTGIHDVHMNQGNKEPYTYQNGIWQDGALGIFNTKTQKIETMFFFMLQGQSTETDETGNSL